MAENAGKQIPILWGHEHNLDKIFRSNQNSINHLKSVLCWTMASFALFRSYQTTIMWFGAAAPSFWEWEDSQCAAVCQELFRGGSDLQSEGLCLADTVVFSSSKGYRDQCARHVAPSFDRSPAARTMIVHTGSNNTKIKRQSGQVLKQIVIC